MAGRLKPAGQNRVGTDRAVKDDPRRTLPHRGCAHPGGKAPLGLFVSGGIFGLADTRVVNAGAANSINSDKPYAQAQPLKRPDLSSGWSQLGKVWVGTSAGESCDSSPNKGVELASLRKSVRTGA
jgi:hypothetical protein